MQPDRGVAIGSVYIFGPVLPRDISTFGVRLFIFIFSLCNSASVDLWLISSSLHTITCSFSYSAYLMGFHILSIRFLNVYVFRVGAVTTSFIVSSIGLHVLSTIEPSQKNTGASQRQRQRDTLEMLYPPPIFVDGCKNVRIISYDAIARHQNIE